MKKLISYFLLYSFLSFLFSSCNKEQNDEQDVTEVENDQTLFKLLDGNQTGITFQNTLTEGPNTNILMYEYFYNGGGVAANDFNGDGLIDLYFSSNMAENKFYLNKGNFTFEDISSKSGAAGREGPWKTGINAVDINADGKMDLYLCYSGALPPEKRTNQLFINTGNDANGIPKFEEKAAEYGIDQPGFSNQSYFLDYDKDGDLDMILLNHNPKNLPILNEAGTAEMLKKDSPEMGLRLFKNTNGKFKDITTTSGINGSELSYGLGLGIADLNQDGWLDFYVSNDYSVPDFLYINNKNGTFTNKLDRSLGHNSQFSMGNDVADINNDGLSDIFTLDMLPEDNYRQKLLLAPDNHASFDLNVRSGFYYQYMRNMLQLNNGNGTFSEIGQQMGVSNTDWSWAALLADYDNDGWKDLFISNGYLRDYTNLDFIKYMDSYVQQKGRLVREDVLELIKRMPASNVVNYIFKNESGNSFKNKTKNWGLDRPSNSNGSAYADLDNDGDLDLIVNNINQPAFIYQNQASEEKKGHFLQIKLNGDIGNTQGIGAKIEIYAQGKVQSITQNPTRGYLSSVTPIVQFGLGETLQVDSLIINWNSDKRQVLKNIKTDQLITLNEREAGKQSNTSSNSKTWFTEVSSTIKYENPDPKINDFERQLLLNSEFSYSGPCIKSGDLNKDGLDDMVIGGATGQAAQIFIQQKNKSFVRISVPDFETDKSAEDAAIAIFDANNDGYNDIYIGSGGYHQFGPQDPLLQDRLYLNDGNGHFKKSLNALPKMHSSTSIAISGDINQDGKSDLFIGSRVIPGEYPKSPESYILLNDGKGNFRNATSEICPQLANAGMITDALFVDLNLDKKQELIVVGEWMSVQIYENTHGKLSEVSEEYLGTARSGWWNAISTGDFNNDGKPDLIIGNMGTNTQFKASPKQPLEMFYKDFDSNGSVDPVFSFYMDGKRYPYVTRDELINQLTIFRPRFTNFTSYADVTTEALFPNNELKDAGHLEANYMKTILLLSGTDRKLTEAKLPAEVQYSPVYSILPLDFDLDGNLDIIFTGNNSHAKIRLGKFDANYGQLLRGDGRGNFSYVSQSQSGFNIWGDVRSALKINNLIYFGINSGSLKTYKWNNQEK